MTRDQIEELMDRLAQKDIVLMKFEDQQHMPVDVDDVMEALS